MPRIPNDADYTRKPTAKGADDFFVLPTDSELEQAAQDAFAEMTRPNFHDEWAVMLCESRQQTLRFIESQREKKLSKFPKLEDERCPLAGTRGQTDVANAERLVKRHGDNLGYVAESKDWIVWDGTCWRRDDGLSVQEKAKETAESLWEEAKTVKVDPDSPIYKRMIAFVCSSSNAHGIKNMVSLAKSEPQIRKPAALLDANPMLLNVANGTLDLQTGRLRDPSRDDLLTKQCPTEFDPNARCPVWERFLDEVFGKNTDLIGYVQRLLGYGVTGNVNEQLLAMFWGEGSNGKSTLVNTVLHVLGRDYGGTPPKTLLVAHKFEGHPAELMTLQGKRLMIAQETESGAQLAEAQIKLLTGGDLITGRGMYENFRSFAPTHKLILCTNHQPKVRGTDYAIWRRLKLIPFTVKFAGKRMDTAMGDKLRAEAPGILAWMVRGCSDWLKSGMQEPACVQIATKEYATEQDEIGQFIAEFCETGRQFVVGSMELYRAFQNAMPDSEMSQTSFGRELSKRGFDKTTTTSGLHKNRKLRKGLRLVSQAAVTQLLASLKQQRK